MHTLETNAPLPSPMPDSPPDVRLRETELFDWAGIAERLADIDFSEGEALQAELKETGDTLHKDRIASLENDRRELLDGLLNNPGDTIAEEISFLANEVFRGRTLAYATRDGGTSLSFVTHDADKGIAEVYEAHAMPNGRTYYRASFWSTEWEGEARPVTLYVDDGANLKVLVSQRVRGENKTVEVTDAVKRRAILESFLTESMRAVRVVKERSDDEAAASDLDARRKLRAYLSSEYRHLAQHALLRPNEEGETVV